MSRTATRTGPYTFGDFLELVREDQKADLLDGVIYMASPENTDDNRLEVWLSFLLNGFVTRRKLGEVYVSRVAFRITDVHGPEPDIAFVSNARLKTRRRGYFDGPPDLVVEIVSPDSVERDYETKRRVYEEAGVGEYWILDPDERRATFLRLEERPRGRARYRKIAPKNHVFESKVAPGFRIDERWLWADPRPDPLGVLTELLAAS